MIGAAVRLAFGLAFLENQRLLVGQTLSRPGAGLVGFLIACTLLLVAVTDAADGLAHGTSSLPLKKTLRRDFPAEGWDQCQSRLTL
ncbi:MAG TPA: hypothetical protein VJ750_00740 [Rhizomicrobium sp.]|nr:hypothetical protein [Rhizomicrobium sp.]